MHTTTKTGTSPTLVSCNSFSPEQKHLAHLTGLQFSPSLLHYRPHSGAAATAASVLLHFSWKSSLMAACSKKKHSFACVCIEIFLILNPSFWKIILLEVSPSISKSLCVHSTWVDVWCFKLGQMLRRVLCSQQPTQELKYLVKNINVCVGYRWQTFWRGKNLY